VGRYLDIATSATQPKSDEATGDEATGDKGSGDFAASKCSRYRCVRKIEVDERRVQKTQNVMERKVSTFGSYVGVVVQWVIESLAIHSRSRRYRSRISTPFLAGWVNALRRLPWGVSTVILIR
jgi:hypothetical protein